jgi:phage terminase large subunit-like protein
MTQINEDTDEMIGYGLEKYEKLKAELKAAKKHRSIEWFSPYGWQTTFVEATKDNKQLALFAANRVGKTEISCSMLSYHLTGEYPHWYDGFRFDAPITAMACGITGDQIRDVLQYKLIGEIDLLEGKFTGQGLIPTEKLGPYITSTGTKNLLKEIHIRHKAGGNSKLLFRSYEQGPAIIRGMSLDWIMIDEEPSYDPMKFYAECLARTATGNKNKGGFVVLTFTPENGVTELVDMLLNKRSDGQFVMTVGWDRAPHLDEKTKQQLLKAIPRHLISAKTQGIPNFGDTQVYKTPEEELYMDPFEIPPHFRILAACDFGIRHPFACVFVAHDVDRDVIYIYDGFRASNEVPPQHAHRIYKKQRGVRVIYPHDGENREKGSGETLKSYYVDAGVNMFRPFSNPDDTNFVEPGIMEIELRMQEGRLKVFKYFKEWFDEYRKYHRNPRNGKIVKEGDDLMDATRYAVMSVPRFGQKKSELGLEYNGLLYPVLDY